MKKILLSLFAVLIVTVSTIFGFSAVAANSDYSVNITGDTLVSAGGIYSYNVKVNGIKQPNGFISFDIILSYDTSVFEFDSISAKAINGWSTLSKTATAGSITICPATADSIAGEEANYAIKTDNVVDYTIKLKAKITTKTDTAITLESAEATGTDYEEYEGSGNNLSVKIKQPLNTPNTISFENGLAKWDAVDNADSYSIQIYKGNDEYKDPISTKATQYDFSTILTDGGSYCFTVIAISNSPNYKDSTESSKSSAYTVRGTLSSPKITLVSNYKDGGLTYQITDTNPKGTVSQYIVELYEKGSNTALVQVPKTSLSENIKIGDQTWKIVAGKEYEASVTAKSSDTEINNDSSPSIRSASALAVSKIKSIAIKTQPKVEYFEGEKLDLSAMVITVTFDDKTTKDVPFADFDKFDFTTSIENGKVLSLNDSRKQITVKFSSTINATTSALTVSTNTCLHSTSHEDNASPTCGTNGYTKVVCDSCGMTLSETVIDATGEHQFGEWVVIYNPTTEVNGLKVRTCSVCNATEQESIPKTGVTTNPDDSSSTTEVEATDDPIETDAETDPIIEDDGMNDLSRVFLIIVIVIFSLILIFIIGAVWLENRRSKARRQYNNRNMNNRRR